MKNREVIEDTIERLTIHWFEAIKKEDYETAQMRSAQIADLEAKLEEHK